MGVPHHKCNSGGGMEKGQIAMLYYPTEDEAV